MRIPSAQVNSDIEKCTFVHELIYIFVQFWRVNMSSPLPKPQKNNFFLNYIIRYPSNIVLS